MDVEALNPSAHVRRFSEQGIALVIVMLTIMTFTVLVASFAYTMKVEMTLARNHNYDDEFEWIGRGAVERARCMLAQKGPPIDCLTNDWAKPCEIAFSERSSAAITIVDMERKWNINALAFPWNPQIQQAMQQALQQALKNEMGVDPTLASTVSDSILDWLDADETPRFNGAEKDYYLHLEPPYLCKDGFIDDMSELLKIKGIRENPEIFWGGSASNHFASAYNMLSDTTFRHGRQPPYYPYGLKDFFTTMGNGRININTASAATLMLLPGVDEQIAANIIKQRAGEDGVDGTEDDTPFMNPGQMNGGPMMGSGGGSGPGGSVSRLPAGVGPGIQPLQAMCDVRSSYFEVTAVATINGVSRTYHAIIHRLPQGPDGPQIIKFYWD